MCAQLADHRDRRSGADATVRGRRRRAWLARRSAAGVRGFRRHSRRRSLEHPSSDRPSSRCVQSGEGVVDGRDQRPGPVEGVPERCGRGPRRSTRGRRWGVARAGRAVRVWQVHPAANDRRTRGGDRWVVAHRRSRHHRRAAAPTRRRDGFPELRPVPAHDRPQEHRLPLEACRSAGGRGERPG